MDVWFASRAARIGVVLLARLAVPYLAVAFRGDRVELHQAVQRLARPRSDLVPTHQVAPPVVHRMQDAGVGGEPIRDDTRDHVLARTEALPHPVGLRHLDRMLPTRLPSRKQHHQDEQSACDSEHYDREHRAEQHPEEHDHSDHGGDPEHSQAQPVAHAPLDVPPDQPFHSGRLEDQRR